MVPPWGDQMIADEEVTITWNLFIYRASGCMGKIHIHILKGLDMRKIAGRTLVIKFGAGGGNRTRTRLSLFGF